MRRFNKRAEMRISISADQSQANEIAASTDFQLNDGFIEAANAVFSVAKTFGVSAHCGRVALIWCIIMFTMISAMELGALYKVVKTLSGQTLYSSGNRSIVARMSGAIFYGNAVCALVLFWRFRKAWKTLAEEWVLAESVFGPDYPQDKCLKRKVAVVVCVVVMGSFSEHLMSIVAKTDFNTEMSFLEWLRLYIIESHAFLIIPSDYSSPLGFAMLIVSETSTLLWNFQDMFVIILGAGLSSRYARLNQHVRNITAEIKDTDECTPREAAASLARWRHVREAYVRQGALVRRADAASGGLILLCNATNFYFICLQVFNTLSESNVAPFNKAYYLVSVAWLCSRAGCVVLAAADVNVQSRLALRHMHTCPQRGYNVEMQRLERQLSGDYVVLSGMGFFKLDRSLLLAAAAALFKYELVLLEYDNK